MILSRMDISAAIKKCPDDLNQLLHALCIRDIQVPSIPNEEAINKIYDRIERKAVELLKTQNIVMGLKNILTRAHFPTELTVNQMIYEIVENKEIVIKAFSNQ